MKLIISILVAILSRATIKIDITKSTNLILSSTEDLYTLNGKNTSNSILKELDFTVNPKMFPFLKIVTIYEKEKIIGEYHEINFNSFKILF